MNNEIQAPPTPPLLVKVEDKMEAIQNACSDSVTATALFSALQKSCTNTPKLLQCTPATVMDSMLACAMIGIIPNGQHNSAWLIPYGKECKVMIGYNGYIDLITRSSDWHSVSAELVYEGERFEVHAGTRNEIIHDIDITKRGNVRDIVATYAIARGPNGAVQREVLDKSDIQKAYASSKNKSLWDGVNRGEMTKKTAVRKLAKYMVLDRVGQYGVAIADDAHGYKYVENVSGSVDDLKNDLEALTGGPAPEPERDPDTGDIIPDYIGQNGGGS